MMYILWRYLGSHLNILNFKMFVLIIFLLLRYLHISRQSPRLSVNGLLVLDIIARPGLAGWMFSFVAEIFHSIDNNKAGNSQWSKRAVERAMIDTRYLQFTVS